MSDRIPDHSITWQPALKVPRTNEVHLRAFVEDAPGSIAMFDEEMRYLAASARWIETMCPGEKDVIGRPFCEVVPESPRDWRFLYQRALAGETVAEDESQFQRRDGRIQWLRQEIRRWHDSSGEIGGIIVVANNVTDLKEAQLALRESNTKLAAETKATAKFYEGGLQVLQAETLSEALDIMISRSIDMLGADMGIIQLLDSSGKPMRVAAQQGFTEEMLDVFFELSCSNDTSRGRALHAGKPVAIEDVELDEAYAPFRSIARKAGYRALISAPLVDRHEVPRGIMVLHYRSPHRPTDADLEHLELYRRRGGDFIESFNADEALRQSKTALASEDKAMAHFYNTGLRLWEAKSIQDGLDATLAGAVDLLGTDMGAIQLVDSTGNSLRLVAHRGLKQEFQDYFCEFSPGQDSAFGRALHSGKLIVVEDTELDSSVQFREIRRAADYRSFVVAPLVDRTGTLLGMLSAYFRAPHKPSVSELRWLELFRRRAADFMHRVGAQEALRESEERLRLAVMASRMGMFDWDLRTRVFSWSDEWYRMLGYEVGEVEPSRDAWLARIHPDDLEKASSAHERTTARPKDIDSDYRIVLANGEVRWIRTHARFLFEAGKPARLIGLKQDVTEARQQLDTQRVLVAELQHRTRNLMAVVQSIAQQTLDNVASLADFEDRFNRRLEALSRVQSLLSRTDDEPITLRSLVAMEMEALGSTFGERITCSGPSVRLRKSAVEMLSLAIHELMTNAIKCGALAVVTGRLSVTWRIDGVLPNRRLVVEWTEHGVEHLQRSAAPARRGYGRTLIEEALPYSLSAETKFEFAADGVYCRICIPLANDPAVTVG